MCSWQYASSDWPEARAMASPAQSMLMPYAQRVPGCPRRKKDMTDRDERFQRVSHLEDEWHVKHSLARARILVLPVRPRLGELPQSGVDGRVAITRHFHVSRLPRLGSSNAREARGVRQKHPQGDLVLRRGESHAVVSEELNVRDLRPREGHGVSGDDIAVAVRTGRLQSAHRAQVSRAARAASRCSSHCYYCLKCT